MKYFNTVDAINKYLEESRAAYKSSNYSHKPSSLGSKCLRKLYYSYFRVEEDYPPDSKGLRIFSTGDAMETMVMEWLKALGLHIPHRNEEGEIPVTHGVPNPQFPIESVRWRIKKGYIDNVAQIGDGLSIYEIKSSNDSKFSQLKQPLDEHLIQGAIYVQCFNDLLRIGKFDHIPEVKGKQATELRFLYINKNNSELKEFCLPKAHLSRIIRELDTKVATVNVMIDSKKLPPKTKDKCNWCPYRKKCKNNWNKI